MSNCPTQWIERGTPLKVAGQPVERILPAAAFELAALPAHRRFGKLTGIEPRLRRQSAAPGAPQCAVENLDARDICVGFVAWDCGNRRGWHLFFPDWKIGLPR